MTTLASLVVKMGLNPDDFTKGSKEIDQGLGGMQNAVEQTRDQFESLGQTIKNTAKVAGVAAGAALVGGLMSAIDAEATNDRLAAQLDLSAAESERIGGVAGQLFADAYGQNLEEVNTAVGAVMSSIKGMASASNADLEKASTHALDFAKTFEVDVAQAAAYAGAHINTGLAKNAEHAFDLITAASQRVPAALREDVLEAADEYGQFLGSLGFNGEQAFGLLVAASAKGKYGIDKMGDSLKEFTLLSTDLGSSSVTDAYTAIGVNATDMSNAILAGGDSAQGAFQKIVSGLLKIKDPTEQAAAAIGLFGTPLEDLNKAEIPEFLAQMAGVGAGLDNVAGAANRMGTTLNDNASTNLQSFWRQMQTAFVEIVGGRVLPVINTVASTLSSQFGPTLETVAGILTGTVIPAVSSLAQWIGENQTPITIIAGLIAAVFLPHLIALGVTATVTKVKVVTAWLLMKAEAIATAAVHSAQIVMMIGRWALMAGQSALYAARVVASWLIVNGISFVAAVATFAVMIASWVSLGFTSMVNAAKVAAAWIMAMGPIGWVIAAVIGLVTLIVVYWDEIVAATKAAWQWVSDAVSAAIDWVVDFVKNNWQLLIAIILGPLGIIIALVITYWDQIVAFIKTSVQKVLDVISFLNSLPGKAAEYFGGFVMAAVRKGAELLDWAKGLPGRLVDQLAGFGESLVGMGRNVIEGLWRGIQAAAGMVKDKITNLIKDIIPGPVRSALGISSPSKVMAEIGRWVPLGLAEGIDSTAAVAERAAENLADSVSEAMGGITGPDMAVAVPSPRMPSTGPASWSDATSSAGGRERRPLHIENYHPPADASPAEVADELDWFSRGGG